ncbi:alpha-(1,3)-fucosyltransferase C-like [Daphnia pulicaria]|uniref:alpha-(1,3)-fucosyltransferase C-like n=1 Tax=Daphnia pulicaria TaxID=35523 RepID=UPI001EE9B441|nr:alpha-(1,3)-fucosyltransferase C-like [Daphnia pulicaria]
MKSLYAKRISVQKLATLLVIVALCYLASSSRNQAASDYRQSVESKEHHQEEPETNATKKILLWNGSRRVEVQVFGKGQDAFAKQNCTYSRCEMSDNRTERPLEHYDAIVVVLNNEFISPDQLKLPEFDSNKRNASQRLVFFTQEPPPALMPYYNTSRFTNFFNWTMTYRMDSDIRLLYGRFIPNENAPVTAEDVSRCREKARNATMKSIHKKTKAVAWMVTHCNTHSQRETYIKELGKYIEVDTYGPCGNRHCPRHVLYSSDPKCYEMLESTYKFYLSFENAICPDYVTEKFFKILGQDLVPIVYGGADYTQHAPAHSYIDALKYKPKELAAYLQLLIANETLYNEYFWWKDYYRVEFTLEDRSRHAFCDLCQKLHEQDDRKSYPDLSAEWGDGNKCKPFNPAWIE